MCSLVDFKVFTPCKNFAAPWEGAGVGLLPRVHADVIHQLVLGFEWFLFAFTVLPQARVLAALRAAHVIHRDVCDHLVHGVEELAADRPLGVGGDVWIHPLACVLLLEARALPHVAQEGSRRVARHPHVLQVRHGAGDRAVVVGRAEVPPAHEVL
jgi:hypothetical protein